MGSTLTGITEMCQMTNEAEITKKNSNFDQEIPQSQTADNPVALQRRASDTNREVNAMNDCQV